MSNTFDKTRFWNTLKLDFATNWRRWSFAFFGALACLFCTFMCLSISLKGDFVDTDIHESVLAMMVAMTYVIFAFCMMLSGSMMFNNMKSKQARISFLVLPASNLEKFLSRWVMTTVGALVVFMAALVVADAMRAAFDLVVGVNPYSSVTLRFLCYGWLDGSAFELIGDMFSSGRGDLVLYGLSAFVVSHSVFMLGSALFRRHAILLTIVAMMVFSFALGINDFMSLLFHTVARNMLSYGSFADSLGVRIAVNLLITVACYWGAYRLFCRSQVVSHKWFNL